MVVPQWSSLQRKQWDIKLLGRHYTSLWLNQTNHQLGCTHLDLLAAAGVHARDVHGAGEDCSVALEACGALVVVALVVVVVVVVLQLCGLLAQPPASAASSLLLLVEALRGCLFHSAACVADCIPVENVGGVNQVAAHFTIGEVEGVSRDVGLAVHL